MEDLNIEQNNRKIPTDVEKKRETEEYAQININNIQIELVHIKSEPSDVTLGSSNNELSGNANDSDEENFTQKMCADRQNNTNIMYSQNLPDIQIKQELSEQCKDEKLNNVYIQSSEDPKLDVIKIEVDVQPLSQDDDSYASSSKFHEDFQFEDDDEKLLEDVTKIQSKLKNLKSSQSPKKTYACEKCDMVFTKKDKLTKHLTVHLGLKHSCDVCHKEFSSKHNMLRHKHVHFGVKPYSCDHCAKSFMEKTYLVAHLRTHFADKLYKCSVCGKEFRERAHLIRHERIHSGERPYTCEVCHKNFKQSAHLSCHRKIHKKKLVLYCDMCKQGFLTKEDLYEHHKVHIGEKAYSCDVCHRQFSQSSHLNDHVRIHNGKRPFNCPICDKPFSQRSTLNRHIKIHSGEKPHSCPVCHKKFKQKTHVTKHVKLHVRDGDIPPSSPQFDHDWNVVEQEIRPLRKKGNTVQQEPLIEDGSTIPMPSPSQDEESNSTEQKAESTYDTEIIFIKTEPL